MFHTFSEKTKVLFGIGIGSLTIFLSIYLFFSLKTFYSTTSMTGVFFPVLAVEFVSNPNELLRILNQEFQVGFLQILDFGIFILFLVCAYLLLTFDYFETKDFLRFKKAVFYLCILIFILLAIAEYFFLFHLVTSNKQQMIFEFKTFSFLVLLKWIVFFLGMAFLGAILWIEGKMYLLKLVGFLYVSAFLVFLLHFKILQLIDLSLILISLGFIGTWFYFFIRILQYKDK